MDEHPLWPLLFLGEPGNKASGWVVNSKFRVILVPWKKLAWPPMFLSPFLLVLSSVLSYFFFCQSFIFHTEMNASFIVVFVFCFGFLLTVLGQLFKSGHLVVTGPPLCWFRTTIVMLFCDSNLAFGGHSWPPPRCSGVFSVDIPSRIVGDSPTHGGILVSWSHFFLPWSWKLSFSVRASCGHLCMCCLPFCPITALLKAILDCWMKRMGIPGPLTCWITTRSCRQVDAWILSSMSLLLGGFSVGLGPLRSPFQQHCLPLPFLLSTMTLFF